MHDQRRKTIKQLAEEKEYISIKELQEIFPDVTVMTIHRDLDALEAQGVITKVRGGARSVRMSGDTKLDLRERENRDEKQTIVRKALQFVKEDSCIFFDAGTTCQMLAKALPDINMTVVTTAPSIAIDLSALTKPSINVLCGNLNRTNLSLSGYNTLNMLDSINIDIAFVGVSGLSEEYGLTCGTESDMYVKKKVIEKSRTSVVLCDSSKFRRIMPFTFAHLADVDYIVGEGSFPESFLSAAEKAGTVVL